MIKFIEGNNDITPYDKEDYLNFIDNDFEGTTSWKGYSIQPLNKLGDDKYTKTQLKEVFEQIIQKTDNGGKWIVKHDDKILPWFIEGDESLFPKICSALKENNVQPSSKGALLCDISDLFYLSDEIVSYSYSLSYKNLDIINTDRILVIKATSHLSLDLLSTNLRILNELLTLVSDEEFTIKKYR
jgi:hypothetical protein